jgi:hypothetical protein
MTTAIVAWNCGVSRTFQNVTVFSSETEFAFTRRRDAIAQTPVLHTRRSAAAALMAHLPPVLVIIHAYVAGALQLIATLAPKPIEAFALAQNTHALLGVTKHMAHICQRVHHIRAFISPFGCRRRDNCRYRAAEMNNGNQYYTLADCDMTFQTKAER